jgi:GNAT superfamily N-acetyltransferase
MSTLPFNIRPAVPEDCAAILALVNELAEYEKLSHAVVATEASFREHLFGNHSAADAILAVRQSKAVGFALFFRSFSTFQGRPGIYLEDLYVQPTARGQGIGKALFAHVAQRAIEQDCGRIEWSVLNWNEPAIRFYESLAAKPQSEWTTFRLDGEALALLTNTELARQTD